MCVSAGRSPTSAGAGIPLVALLVWQVAAQLPDGGFVYALAGFRLDALHALSGSDIPLRERVTALSDPALLSGLVLVVPAALAGLRRLRGDRVLLVTFSAWLAAAVVGVMGGGSYWPHYLIELVPVSCVGAAVLLAAAPARLRIAVLGAATALSLITAIAGAIYVGQHPLRRPELAVARYVRSHSRPGDTQYVMYARANVAYYAGLPTPYPYEWSLMVRAVPGARTRLQHLLGSDRRPTWVVQWQAPDRWQLDPGGRTAQLLRAGLSPGRRRLRPSGVRAHGPPGTAAADGSLLRLRRPAHPRRAALRMPRAWIVIPTYNEAENLEPLIAAVRAALAEGAPGVAASILVVDDDSPDGTGRVADRLAARHANVHVLHRPGKSGLAGAYVAGFRCALAAGADYVLEMDADFSHDPADLPRLLATARAGADVVLGSRCVPGGSVSGWSPARQMLSRAGGFYARSVLGSSIRDLTGGFKCFRASSLRAIGLDAFGRRWLRLPGRGHLPGGAGGAPDRGGPDHLPRAAGRPVEDVAGDRRRGDLAHPRHALRRRTPSRCRAGDSASWVSGCS